MVSFSKESSSFLAFDSRLSSTASSYTFLVAVSFSAATSVFSTEGAASASTASSFSSTEGDSD